MAYTDKELAKDLAYWIQTYENLDQFYKRGQFFIDKGTYNKDRATKLFLNAVNRFYKNYASANAFSASSINAPTRKLAATKLREDFERHHAYYAERQRLSRNPSKNKWIPAHAVRSNKDGSVSVMR